MVQANSEGEYFFLGSGRYIDVFNKKYEHVKRFHVSSPSFKTMKDEATTFLICHVDHKQTVIHIQGVEQKRFEPPPPPKGNPMLDVLYLTSHLQRVFTERQLNLFVVNEEERKERSEDVRNYYKTSLQMETTLNIVEDVR